MSSAVAGCPLCDGDGGRLIARQGPLRVVRPDEAGFPAFYRVIWNAHVPEFSDLAADERHRCMEAVVAVEQVLRRRLSPRKVNVASLGNMVAHLHWHVIARFEWDSHWPAPVWAEPRRPVPDERVQALATGLHDLDEDVVRALAALAPIDTGL